MQGKTSVIREREKRSLTVIVCHNISEAVLACRPSGCTSAVGSTSTGQEESYSGGTAVEIYTTVTLLSTLMSQL